MKHKIRVLHAITRFIDGGADKNTFCAIQALDSSRYEVGLLIGRDSHSAMLSKLNSVRIHKVNSLVRHISPTADLQAFLEIYKIIKHYRYEIVHTHTAKAGILGRAAARLAGVPCIIHGLHGATFHPSLSLWRRSFYRYLEKAAAKWTDCIVSVGADLTDRYLDVGVGRPEQYRIIHSGMQLDDFYLAGDLPAETLIEKRRSMGLDAKDIIVGQVGRLEYRKGYIYLLEVAKRLHKVHPLLKFLFIGEGPQRLELEQFIQQNGLQDVVHLTGFRRDIAEVMAILDVFAFASLWEGLPQVLVQAAIVGRPIVTFAVEGAREVVQDNINGFVVNLGDVDRLVNCIKYLISHPSEAREMGRRGRDIIGKQWAVEMQMQKTCELYDEIVKKHLL